jgi:hypothetical protein
MKIKERMTKPRIAAYVISCVIPLLAIGFGIFLLLNDTILNLNFLIVMIILPIVTSVLLFCTIFSKMRISAKIVVVILLLLIFVVLFIFGFAFGHFESLRRYEGTKAKQRFGEIVHWETLPNLDEIGQPYSIEYIDYYSSRFLIFTNEVDALICQYTSAEYEMQKSLLEGKYVFQTEPMTASGYSCDPTVSIDGYLFRTLTIDDVYGNVIHYPKSMAFVAVNDETQEIIYLSAYDDDLDFIQSLEEFLKVDCGWNRIR